MASFLRTSRLQALRHPWFTTLFAAVAVVAVLYFVTAVSVAEVLRPMYDPVQHTISELAVGRYGGIQVSAFCVLGVGLLALQHGLWRRLQASVLSRSGLVLLALCAVATFVAAAFPTDLKGSVVHTVSGDIHAWMASVGYGCLILGSLLLSIHFRHDEHWRSYHRPSLALALLGTAASIAMALTTHTAFLGLTQRAMALPLLLWVLLTAVRLYTLPAPSSTLPPLISSSRLPDEPSNDFWVRHGGDARTTAAVCCHCDHGQTPQRRRSRGLRRLRE